MHGRRLAPLGLSLLLCCSLVFGEPSSQTCSDSELGQCSSGASQQLLHAEVWREQLGWTSSKLATGESMGIRGVMAADGFKPKEPVVKQPFDTVINGNSMMWRSPFPAVVSQKFWSKTDSVRKVVCRLALEMQKGSSSKWAGYITHLPTQFDTLAYWSKGELEELQNEQLKYDATYGGREVDVAYDGLVETTPGTIITRDVWRWAWTIVASRSFSFTYVGGLDASILAVIILSAGGLYLLLRTSAPTVAWWVLNGTIVAAVLNKSWGVVSESWVDSVAILPIMDDFNHATDPNLLLEYKAGKGNLMMVAGPDGIQSGDQVFISYGNNTNDHYLMVYGFTIPDNPEEVYKLQNVNDKLLKHADVSAGRLKYVNNTELTRKLKEVGLGTRGFKVTDIQAVAQLIGSDESFFEGEDAVWKDPVLEAQVLKALMSLLEDEVGSWPTVVEEDDRLLSKESQGKSSRWTMAVQYRRRRKAVLLEGLSMVQKGYAAAQIAAEKKLNKGKTS